MPRLLRRSAFALLLLSTAAAAGPVADFEKGFRPLYASYRAALFNTNSGKTDLAVAALDKLSAGWAALEADYGIVPPPQYEDDPQWLSTLEAVAAKVDEAKKLVAEGQPVHAHEVLEAVRNLIGDLHARNGIETFSDRMNAYHAAMEETLAVDLSTLDAAGVATLREHAAVLSYLAGVVMADPPPEAASDHAYSELSVAFGSSVDTFLAAARSGDTAAVKAAVAALKPAYSKLFLQFG